MSARRRVGDAYPFLISVPHGGTDIPVQVRDEIALSAGQIAYYADPATPDLFDFRNQVAACLQASVSRIVVDLNRPPYPLPARSADGIVKTRTIRGEAVYVHGGLPSITTIHRLLMDHYFPYHARIDNLVETCPVAIAFDCHSMLPVSPPTKKDAGKIRPLICLGNSGDAKGLPRKGRLVTCPPRWLDLLAATFRDVFGYTKEVALNTPFSGGFITNAHYWHKGIPWVQIEINRVLYEYGDLATPEHSAPDGQRVAEVRELCWEALIGFWDALGGENGIPPSR